MPAASGLAFVLIVAGTGTEKPAGRLRSVSDVRAAIAALLERVREVRERARARDKRDQDMVWPADLNASEVQDG